MFRAGQSPQIAKNLYLLYRRNETKSLDFQFTKSLAIRGEQQLSLSLSRIFSKEHGGKGVERERRTKA